MADFRPETTVYLYRATGVDNGNQPYFTSEGAKMAWYNSHSPRSYSVYSYQRENREYIRVDDKAENLRYYDMMGFRNGSGKWVLCRIESVEFINPNCTEITYSVDYMQTYIENITFGSCWVEREMQTGDWAGSDPAFNNLQPEGIETGVLTRTRVNTDVFNYDRFKLVVLSTYDIEGDPNFFDFSLLNGYPIGINKLIFDLSFSGMTDLGNALSNYEKKGIDVSRAIVGMFVVPQEYADAPNYVQKMDVIKPWPGITGYRVVNAKCFSGEFFRLELSNRRGNEQELRPEILMKSGGGNMKLTMIGSFGAGNGGSILYPDEYEGHAMDFGVIRYDDVQAPFVCDAFSSWLAANTGNIGTSMAASIGGAIAMSVVNPALAPLGAVNAVGAVGSALGKVWDKSKDPAALGGQVAGSVLEVVLDNYGFTVNWLHPTDENLRSIDEFFGWYGYRTNRYKVPNVNTRPKWNYVKTSDAVCRGPFSKKAQDFMQSLMNAGVTFWHLAGGEEISGPWTIDQNME